AGRIADPALFLTPLVHRFGWKLDDWSRLGQGTLTGHLLECGMQITGGYYADPGFKDVPRLADCGFPIAEVQPDGAFVVTKLPDTGGCVTQGTVKEQLLYEVHDPAAYLTPDVTADFRGVSIAEAGPDRVQVAGASGTARPEKLKVTIGFDGGFLGEAGVSYAGPNAKARATLAAEVAKERLTRINQLGGELRIDLIGVNSLYQTAGIEAADAADIRLHVGLRSQDRGDIETMLWEVESLLCCGPAGGGGYRGQVTPCVVTHSCLIARDQVKPSFEMFTA
ncbi:MAG TPA: acyclic terpene utilization AtuA family protein, partial [Rhodopila sp.]|nr:acyclic terpene utilization AtuA family protein [Rhodopila sp.]